ncbi:MAG: peptidoglycan-binding protein [Candidatus Pacebacteria bacterium]|nr:peptidoglycan-binding protein [Candidatus Paceibacterota bacterium]
MNTFMFRIVSIVFFIACAGLVYLGYVLLRPTPYLSGEAPKKVVVTESEPEESELMGNSRFDESDPEFLDSLLEEETPNETTPVVETETEVNVSSSEHASLISALQKLIDDKIYMKVGSRGTRVGSVQEFLNIYHTKQVRADNDYGAGTKTRVAEFQKAVGVTADGETGPQTYQKMIDWLKKQ